MSEEDTQSSLEEQNEKEAAKEAYIEGYKIGYDVEHFSEKTLSFVETRFERWWSRQNSE